MAENQLQVEKWFSILRNLNIYYRLRDVHALATDLVHYRLKLTPSNTLVYVFGLALREQAKNVDALYRQYLWKLPPWLLYGALWYANVPSATRLLSEHAKPDYVPELFTKVAQQYTTLKPPVKPTQQVGNPLVFPKATTAAQRQQQHLEELWAQWYATGDARWVPLLVQRVGDHDTLVEISKAAHQYHANNEDDQDASAANLVMDVVCKTPTEKLLMGSLIYDKRLFEYVNKFASVKQDDA